MATTPLSSLPKWLHYFDTISSTNNYAMTLVDDGMAQHGEAIWAKHQTAGKGQRGKKWQDSADNLKFSLIIKPSINPENIFGSNIIVTTTIAGYLKTLLPEDCQIHIKWPNDIYLNDKKACGILIENIFRGTAWKCAIIGIGLNVNQLLFPEELHRATSLRKESLQCYDQFEIIQDLRSGLTNALDRYFKDNRLDDHLLVYNALLYKKDETVNFKDLKTGKKFQAFVSEVDKSGNLLLLNTTGLRTYGSGSLEWLFD